MITKFKITIINREITPSFRHVTPLTTPVRLHSALVALLRQDKSDNESVETQSLSENENENHADEELVLLAHSAHTRIADDADGHTGSQATAQEKK